MKKSLLCIAACAALSFTVLPLTACNGGDEGGLTKYSVEAAYDEETRTLTGVAEVDYFNSTENEIGALEFNLWGNAYREGAKYAPVSDALEGKAYYNGRSYGKMEVEKVEGCASWETGGEDMTNLTVALTKPLFPEERVSVTVYYTLTLAEVNHRTGVTERSVNLGNFYPVLCAYTSEGFLKTPYIPCGDPFVSECADYEVSFTIPKNFTAATSGKESGRTEGEKSVTVNYKLENARDFAAVLYPDCKTVSKNIRGCEVTAYYQGEEPTKSFAAACESLEYFWEKFALYPYSTYTIAYTPLSVSGMEYPALVMVNDDLEEGDGIYTAVHETAHQWWYALVGNDQVNCAYIDEGLAEYSTLNFFETHPDYGFTRTALLGNAIKAYRAYYSVYNQIFGNADTTMRRNLADFASDYEYVNVAYNKSLLMFESVRTAMGDEKFFKALSDFCNANKFGIASQEEMISRFASLHDVEGLFMGYIEGKVVI